MRKFCSLILMCLFISFSAVAADFWVETQMTRSGGKNNSQVLGIVSGNVAGPVGYFVLGQAISDGYKQAYAGPTLKLGPVEVGIGIGRENMPDSTRRAAYALGDIDKVSFLWSYEDGGSGPWHTAKVTYKVTDKLGIGAMEQSFFGLGPRVEYDLAKGVQLWGALARERNNDGKVNGKIGLAFTF